MSMELKSVNTDIGLRTSSTGLVMSLTDAGLGTDDVAILLTFRATETAKLSFLYFLFTPN